MGMDWRHGVALKLLICLLLERGWRPRGTPDTVIKLEEVFCGSARPREGDMLRIGWGWDSLVAH